MTNTKKILENGLMDLCLQKPFLSISVIELTTTCHLSRATFYLHYASISDVLFSIESKILRDLEDMNATEYNSLEELCLDIINYCDRERKAIKVVLSVHGSHFEKKVERIVSPIILNSIKSDDTDPIFNEFIVTFLIHGSFGIILKWIESGKKYDKKKLIKDFIYYFKNPTTDDQFLLKKRVF